MSSEQKDALLDLLRKHNHPGITPDIRRELAESKCRGEWEADKEQMEENWGEAIIYIECTEFSHYYY